MTKKVGIALGGGGAKGLAHIAVLEAVEELGVAISAVSATSIGAIIGSLYASGMTAKEVRQNIDDILATAVEAGVLTAVVGGALGTLALVAFVGPATRKRRRPPSAQRTRNRIFMLLMVVIVGVFVWLNMRRHM